MSEAAHSPLGPSSAERWMKCPASVRATEGLPDTDSEYAIEGTAAHTLAEWCRHEDRVAKEWLGRKVDVKLVDGSFRLVEVGQEMVDCVQAFVDFVNDIEGDLQLTECRARYTKYVPNGFGTLDGAVLRFGSGDIIDLKYGKGVQKFAENNEQLMLYALGVYLDINWLFDFEKFKLVIFQPRLDHIDEWEISVEDLLKWAEEVLVPAYKATLNPKAHFVPGAHCQFCKIRATCMVRASSVFKAVVDEFDTVETTAPKTAGAAERTATLTNAEIAHALEALPNVKAWCKAIEAKAVSEIAAGRSVGSYKLVGGRSNRGWGMPVIEVIDLLTRVGADRKDLLTEELISPTAAEKLLGKKHEVWKAEGLVVKPPGKPTLAPGSDKRPPINVTDGFDIVSEE
jgi:hypothetical protein